LAERQAFAIVEQDVRLVGKGTYAEQPAKHKPSSAACDIRPLQRPFAIGTPGLAVPGAKP
jgi:hypothetical protein